MPIKFKRVHEESLRGYGLVIFWIAAINIIFSSKIGGHTSIGIRLFKWEIGLTLSQWTGWLPL